MTVALNSLTFTRTSTLNWTAQASTPGLANPTTNNNTPSKSSTLKTGIANATAGGADELYYALLTIAASGSFTINLQSFTDIVGQTGALFTRLKYFKFRLLGTGETAPDGTTAGTACSSIKVAGGATNPNTLGMGGTTPSMQINNASEWEYQDGSGAGIPVSATAENVTITNNDAGNSAVVVVILSGGST